MAILELQPAPNRARAAVARVHGAYHVLAAEPVRAGDTVLTLEGDLTREASRYTVQIDMDLHLQVPAEAALELLLDRYCWRFLNHSCDPSAFLCGRNLVARRRIRPWDEITFDYDSTEWDMAEPFRCHCGSPRCRGLIRGYRHLAIAQRKHLRPYLATYLKAWQDAGAAPPGIATTA